MRTSVRAEALRERRRADRRATVRQNATLLKYIPELTQNVSQFSFVGHPTEENLKRIRDARRRLLRFLPSACRDAFQGLEVAELRRPGNALSDRLIWPVLS